MSKQMVTDTVPSISSGNVRRRDVNASPFDKSCDLQGGMKLRVGLLAVTNDGPEEETWWSPELYYAAWGNDLHRSAWYIYLLTVQLQS